MDPERKLPELDDDMPPIDDELREAMEDLLRRQEKCLKLHKWLILLIVTCFWNPIGVIALFANAILSITWGSRLSRRAWALVRQAYPWLHDIPFLYGISTKNHYNGVTAGTRIMAEAQKSHDELTVKLLEFWDKNMFYMLGGMAGYLAALLLLGWLVPRSWRV